MTNRLHLLKQPYRDIAERWVAALRSGEYRQGRGWLCMNGHYCCLGVLQGPVLNHRIIDYDDCLFGPTVDKSGLQSSRGHSDTHEALVKINDGGTTFPQIADLIESVPVGLWRDECFESGRQPAEEEQQRWPSV